MYDIILVSTALFSLLRQNIMTEEKLQVVLYIAYENVGKSKQKHICIRHKKNPAPPVKKIFPSECSLQRNFYIYGQGHVQPSDLDFLTYSRGGSRWIISYCGWVRVNKHLTRAPQVLILSEVTVQISNRMIPINFSIFIFNELK